ncbi:hypothetical protein DPMN_099528 [Dreissena polymorpha]|uniref:Uncharacterized protein n=1 Tax=Dreissena polymorpha TaxID=45954 RepID=A0A9D4R7B4_DREPO|nr:hypothetical protein DPMN_067849 [Dreissena polymorpha]KAH3856933.1 hypothetical protein DPMN_099528 [Dreissena polymorpha]
MNIVKTPTRSVLKQENLVNQMRIVLCGPEIKDFDPSSAVLHWLSSGQGSRHLTYKPRQPKETVCEPSTSQVTQGSSISDTEKLAHDVFNKLSEEQRLLVKEKMSKDQCSFQ